MNIRAIIDFLLEQPAIYRCFHSVFSRKKFEYLKRYLVTKESDRAIKVLDLGCGPGTNAFMFVDKSKYLYLGIDMNPKYVEVASRTYPLDFRCADITGLEARGLYDVVLINSVMHHLTDPEASKVLSAARTALDKAGECVVLDMIPTQKASVVNSIQRLLIHLDRGALCRSLEDLERLLCSYFKLRKTYSFSIAVCGITLWDLRLFVCGR